MQIDFLFRMRVADGIHVFRKFLSSVYVHLHLGCFENTFKRSG